MTQELARAIRRHYAGAAPSRYLTFLAQEQYEALEYLNLHKGFVEGWFLPCFTDYRKLRDITAMARACGVDGLDDRIWGAEFPSFLPLATLEPVHEGERLNEVGAFLVIASQPADCPVYVLVRESLMLIPLASSLSSFARGNAWQGLPQPVHRRCGRPYDAFAWGRAPAPRQAPQVSGA